MYLSLIGPANKALCPLPGPGRPLQLAIGTGVSPGLHLQGQVVSI